MGGRQAKCVPLTPPLSLKALGITAHSTLEDAVRALMTMRKELQSLDAHGASQDVMGNDTTDTTDSGPELRRRRNSSCGDKAAVGSRQDGLDRSLPSKSNLVVCLSSGKDGPHSFQVLGDAVGKAKHKRLVDLGVKSSSEDSDGGVEVVPRLILGEIPNTRSGGFSAILGRVVPRGLCRCRQNRRRCGKCCENISLRMWKLLPHRCQGRLQPYVAHVRFYVLCANWAIQWFWQDRHELWREFKESLIADTCALGGPPPRHAVKVWEEMRPFGYALGLGALYSFWDVGRRFLWPEMLPPMDLTL
eukprot:TRINITY_DN67766_c0_g1_i1.p1 TRINITY_DN67766_c0_g1~~TRINITY_DN67766_c0_g1_i1.p1  ORF type:complete len:303 (-),score=30.99 TRINITY_DN67766_c0_g1_i1:77-985(-)